MFVVKNFKHWVFNQLEPLSTSNEIKAYVIDTFSKPYQFDMSKKSLVVAKTTAKSFVDHQKIGDWALWINSFNSSYEHSSVTHALGQLSYNKCYILLQRRVKLYEELADELPNITLQINLQLNDFTNSNNNELISV